MSYAYVLHEDREHGAVTCGHTRATTTVEGAETELSQQLRAWALELMARLDLGDGSYSAYLVDLTANSDYDTCDALAVEDIVWYSGVEHVPVS